MPSARDGRTSCRFCAAPLELTVVDLGMSPLCESFLPRRADRGDGAVLPAPRPRLRAVLARAAPGVRRAGGDLHRVRVLLGVLDGVGRARAPVRRDDPRAARPRRRTTSSSSSPRTTATSCSTSSARRSDPRASIRRRTSRRPPRSAACRRSSRSSARDSRGSSSTRASARARRREQRPRAGARPERLRRRRADPARADGTATFEFPHLLRLLDGLQYDTIYHEHFSYFSLATISRDLRRPRSRGLRRRGAVDARRLAPRLRAARGGPHAVERGGRASSSRARRRADCARRALRALRRGREGVEARAPRAADRAPARREAGRRLRGARARATRSSTTAGSAPTSSTTRSTATRTSTGCFTPGTHIPIHPPERIAETRPDYVARPAVEPRRRDREPARVRPRVGRAAHRPDPARRGRSRVDKHAARPK